MMMFGIVLDRWVSTWLAVVVVLLWLVVEIVLRRKQIRALYGRLRCYGAAHKMETILLCVVIGIVVGGLSGLGIGLSLTKPVPSKATTPVEQEESQALPPSKVPEPEPKKQVIPTGDSPVKPSRKETTSPQKEPPAPHVSAPGGIAIGRDNLGTAIVNPPVNPYAPVVTYDFNGTKHVQQGNRFQAIVGKELVVFNQLLALQKQQDWITLRDTCEAQIKETPEWLTPYLFAGVALSNMGKREEAIKQLEYVSEKSGGREEYKDAERILRELRKPQD